MSGIVRHSLTRLAALLLALALGGCGLFPGDVDETRGWSAARLYSEARQNLEGRDYERAMQRPVADFMTRSVVTCMAHVELARAAKLLTNHKIHRLVVVEERNDGRVWPVGVLSQTDLVRNMGEQ